MNLIDLFKSVQLDGVRLNAGIASANFSFQQIDRNMAWELYVEMLTRIVTQRLPCESGDEESALNSTYNLFPITREILRRRGTKAIHSSKIAIVVLNQIVRPFTTKWHRESLSGAFKKKSKRQEFRKELEVLQENLRKYSRLLAKIAAVEDLTDLESTGGK